jgi:hypothetical protein
VIHRRKQDSKRGNRSKFIQKNLLGVFKNKVLKKVISLTYVHVTMCKTICNFSVTSTRCKEVTLLELCGRDSHNLMKSKVEFKFTIQQETKFLGGGDI